MHAKGACMHVSMQQLGILRIVEFSTDFVLCCIVPVEAILTFICLKFREGGRNPV